MRYIYESPDKGKTIYRTPMGVPNAKRELVPEENLFVEVNDEGSLIILEAGVGFHGIIKEVEK